MNTTNAIRATVLGAGAWGTTFAKVLADAGCAVRLWSREAEVATEVNASHTNERFLPGFTLPATIIGTSDPAVALSDAELVVVAIPSQVARATLTPMAQFFAPEAIIA